MSVGRAKDFTCILALRESGAVTDDEIAKLVRLHKLGTAWKTFTGRFNEN